MCPKSFLRTDWTDFSKILTQSHWQSRADARPFRFFFYRFYLFTEIRNKIICVRDRYSELIGPISIKFQHNVTGSPGLMHDLLDFFYFIAFIFLQKSEIKYICPRPFLRTDCADFSQILTQCHRHSRGDAQPF